ncbi:hypothetical protein [Taibaiella koreensis]|uniref:hypothetical protein n=1 Tax=Taibaiella koreensis TaxID=1268548 RepID=UPI000E59B03B|nr:hypothetical protein [Taibaiella koreensis]
MSKFITALPFIIFFAGLAQLLLALGSIAIPFVLDWKREMRKVNALTRNIFYTYSVYIFGTNVWLGITSMAMPALLCDRSPLSVAVTLFTALYWWGRVMIQFRFGKAEGRPAGTVFVLAELLLWLLFLLLSLVYTLAALYNLNVL